MMSKSTKTVHISDLLHDILRKKKYDSKKPIQTIVNEILEKELSGENNNG
ncbi:unnamed protein product [marine sediment metagenome]|uniref:Uncharacterized protein n=1 Tax=marine sediment metagenome TaxID=412755 RepID=X1SDQ6_9ZZZZ